MSPPELVAKQFADTMEALANDDVPSSVSYAIDDDNYLSLQIETSTDEERDRLFARAAFADALRQHEPVLREQGLILDHVLIESQETIERDWNGIPFESLLRALSPHLWFNRNPHAPAPDSVDTKALLELLRQD